MAKPDKVREELRGILLDIARDRLAKPGDRLKAADILLRADRETPGNKPELTLEELRSAKQKAGAALRRARIALENAGLSPADAPLTPDHEGTDR